MRPVVEQHWGDCLDACELRRMGFLNGGRYHLQAGIRWPKINAMIIDPTAIQITLNNGQQQTFGISWARCLADSYRPWLVCHCGERFAKLYRGYAGYACRQCLDIWYACQTVSTRKRQIKRLSKLAAQIDGRPWQYIEASHIIFPKRPRGMHRRRYWRLRGIAAYVEAKLALQNGRLGAKLS